MPLHKFIHKYPQPPSTPPVAVLRYPAEDANYPAKRDHTHKWKIFEQKDIIVQSHNTSFPCKSSYDSLHLHFNHEKSYCIVFGKRRVHDIAPMLLGDALLPWVDSVRCLGVYIVGNNKLSFDFAYTKRCFYAAFENIMSHARSLEQIIQLSVVESYFLPVLTYAIGTLSVTQRQLHDLNVCWNTAYRVTFGFNRWESVKCFICGMGRLSLIYIIKLHRINFFFASYS
jgi:hypothetical protein